jgi:predicted ATP-grasp superfamily ATP-dependent carboligase
VRRGRRALLTADESPASLASVRALRSAGWEVHLAVTRDDTYAARSRAVARVLRLRADGADPERYAHELAAAVRAAPVDVVLPATESTLRALTGREALLGDGVAVGTCSTEALELATSKAAFQQLAGEAGLATLETVEVDEAGLDAVAARLPVPAVAKPLRSVQDEGGRLVTLEVERVDDVDGLRRLLYRAPEHRWLVQRRVEGTLAAVGGVAWRGRLVCATHQVSPRIWPPQRGITAFATTVAPDRDRELGVARLMELVGWSGVFGVQFLLTDDAAYAIDLNPRIYGSIGLAIAAGQSLPAIWAELLVGGEPRVAPARVGVGYRAEEDDVRALAAAFRAGRRAEALRGLMPRPGTAHAVFSWRDPAPSAVSVAKAWGALRG